MIISLIEITQQDIIPHFQHLNINLKLTIFLYHHLKLYEKLSIQQFIVKINKDKIGKNQKSYPFLIINIFNKFL